MITLSKLDKSYLFGAKKWTDEKMNLPEELQKALTELLFTRPSKIQQYTIPIITKKQEDGSFVNLIAQSQNGSGKTLAFGLGSLCRIDPSLNEVQVVVLSPTRELSRQTFQIYQKLSKYLRTSLELVTLEKKRLDFNQVMLGTPGKMFDVTKRFKPKFKNVRVFVLDEADMLFTSQQMQGQTLMVHKNLNPKKQCLLFSATFPEEVKEQATKIIKEAAFLQMKKEELTLKGVQQLYIEVDERAREETLHSLYKEIEVKQTVVFVNKRDTSKCLYKFMHERGHNVSVLFGKEMSPEERDLTIDKFQSKETRILLTTNVLARGIDNRTVTLVVNYDLPLTFTPNPADKKLDFETYLHRIGRTGRFGDEGLALNFVKNQQDRKFLKDIENYYDCKIKPLTSIQELSPLLEKLEGDDY